MSPTQAHDLVERLYDEHRDAVMRFARSRNYELADDVVSETFAIALRRADAVPAGYERVWLIGVADKVLRNLQRKELRAATLPRVLEPHASTSSSPHEPPVVGPALSELPEIERSVLTLTAFEGLSATEAGERLGLTPGSTRNVMTRGRRNLAVRLAAFGVLLLVPLLFFLSGERLTEPRPQARQLADTLREAATLTTDATVRTAGAEPARYRVRVDWASGRTRIDLPGGMTAQGAIGAPATIVPKPGIPATQRARTGRKHAAALRALQTITGGDLERFLRSARPDQTATRAADAGAPASTVVRGPFITSDGRRVELRVTLGGHPTALRQLQIRSSARPAAAWTTVDVSGWSVRLPAAGQSADPAPTDGRRPSALRGTGSNDRDERIPGSPASGDKPAPVSPRAPGPVRSVDRQTAERNRATVASVPGYDGTTGPVLYTRSVTTSHSRDPQSGRTSRTQTLERESWTEAGGGRRERAITRAFGPTSGRLLSATERWSSPRLQVELPLQGEAEGSLPGPSVFCRPLASPPPGPTPEQAALGAARADLAALPTGPVVRGRSTRVFDYRPAPATGASEVRPPETQYHLDAETGVPLRRTLRAFGAQEVVVRTDFTVWEQRPAGGPSTDLAGQTPDAFRLRQPGRCRAEPPTP